MESGGARPPEARPGIPSQHQSNSAARGKRPVMGDTPLAHDKCGNVASKSTFNVTRGGKHRSSGSEVAHKRAKRPQDSSNLKANATVASVPKIRQMKAASSLTTDVPSPGEPRWHVVNPPTDKNRRKSVKDEDVSVPKMQPSHKLHVKPRIWASSRSELFAVLPELAKSTNGISWLCSETPVLILEDSNSNWPGDTWDTATTFSLTMIREFSCLSRDLDVPTPSVRTQQPFAGATPMGPTAISVQNHCRLAGRDSQPRDSYLLNCASGTENPVQPGPSGGFQPDLNIAWQGSLALSQDVALPHSPLEQYFSDWLDYMRSTHTIPGVTYLPLGTSPIPLAPENGSQASNSSCKSTKVNSCLSLEQADDKLACVPQHGVWTTGALGLLTSNADDEVTDELVLMYPEFSQVSPRPTTPGPHRGAGSQQDYLENCNQDHQPLSAPPRNPPDPMSRQPYFTRHHHRSSANGPLQQPSLAFTRSFGSDWGGVSRISDRPSSGIHNSGMARVYSQPNPLLEWRPSDWGIYTNPIPPHSDIRVVTSDTLVRQDSTQEREACYQGGMYTPPSSYYVVPGSPKIQVFTVDGYSSPCTTWDSGSYNSGLSTGYPVSSMRSTIAAVAIHNPPPERRSHPEFPVGAKAMVNTKGFSSGPQGRGKLPKFTKIRDHLQVSPARTRPVLDGVPDQRIPKKLPSEIQVLVDSYEHSVPVIVIMSRSCTLFPRHLPACYAYSYLGFFRLTKITSERMVPGSERELPKNCVGGWVRWLLKFTWASGGEDFLPDSCSPLAPWWSPLSREDSQPGGSNHKIWRDLSKQGYSVLPLHLLQPFGSPFGEFPRGWYCVNCGKLNEQIFLRHRSCSYCQPSPSAALGYALCLDIVRDPRDAILTSLPTNLCPDGMESTAVLWGDNMRTFSYAIRGGVIAKHIFTCNQAALQGEPTMLFQDFQLHVELSRQRDKGLGTAPGPYFMYLAGLGHHHESRVVAWKDVPPCVTQAREFLLHRGRFYGECDNIDINKLTTLAWVTTGSRKGVIEAKESYVSILCLGADVHLSLVPKGGFSSSNEAAVSSSNSKIAAEKGNTKKRKDVLLVTLVHGDILMLFGDDFECSTKRTGTTILLYGSYVPERRYKA